VAVGAHDLVGAEGTVRRGGFVQLNGELWRAHTADGSELVAGQQVRVEDVESDLRLVVGSGTSPSEEGTT
jgi:membrane protein implicated in regulation of membrane protease activity